MKNLSEINTVRDENLGDIPSASPSSPLRDPICDRTMVDTLLEAMFAQEVFDDGVSPSNTITTKASISGLFYTLRFKRVFNNVFVTGRLSSTAGGSLNAQTIGTIINEYYRPKSGYSQNIIATREDNTGNVMQLQFQSSGNIVALHQSGTLQIGVGYNINGFYYTGD